MLLGLETFSYYLAFSFGKMDIFTFIRKAKKLGLDGVQINMEGDGLGHLGGDTTEHLHKVRTLCDELGLFIDLDGCGTDPESLYHYLDICKALKVDRLRTYSSFGGAVNEELDKAIKDFKTVAPAFANEGVRIAYENHEYETSNDILRVIDHVNNPIVGTHIDTGNSMMMWEDPLVAVRNMAPRAVSTHFKDHLVIELDGTPMIVGVPLGQGSIDLYDCYRLLAEYTDLDRINIEVCYGYMAPFRVTPDQGEGAKLGDGAFKVNRAPFAADIVAPHLLAPVKGRFQSFAWQEIADRASPNELEDLLARQDAAVKTSVQFVRQLRSRYEQSVGPE